MKKNRYFILAIITILFITSCGKPDEYDPTLLHGKWKQSSLHEVYKSDGTGYTWDESDDVTEEEAQPFEWELNKDQLLQIHIMEMGGNIPKKYTITDLTSTTLKYEDNYGNSYNFSKVQ